MENVAGWKQMTQKYVEHAHRLEENELEEWTEQLANDPPNFILKNPRKDVKWKLHGVCWEMNY